MSEIRRTVLIFGSISLTEAWGATSPPNTHGTAGGRPALLDPERSSVGPRSRGPRSGSSEPKGCGTRPADGLSRPSESIPRSPLAASASVTTTDLGVTMSVLPTGSISIRAGGNRPLLLAGGKLGLVTDGREFAVPTTEG